MWSPSKYSPFDTIHLSHLRFHRWKHPWNSSSLKPFSSDVVSRLIVVTSPKCRPRSTNLHLGNKKKHRRLNPANKGDVQAQWWNCAPKTHVRLMQSVWGHCCGGESNASPPTIPVARDAHNLSEASKPPHRKLRWQFDPQVQIRGAQFHGSQKKPSTLLWFFICFSMIFSFSANLPVSTHCSATSARCRTRRSTIRRLWWPFPRIHHFPLRFSSQHNTLSVTTFAQEWAVLVQSWCKPFSFPNVPSKSWEQTTFPNQVLLLLF